MGKKDKLEIEGYDGIVSNHKKGKEGLVVAARKGTFVSMEKISEMDNILSVQIVYPEITIRVIVCHGPQEDDEKETRTGFFENLAVEIERSNSSEEIPIVMGDLNAKISGTMNETTHVSGNGKLLNELLDETQMKVVNFHEKTEGKWTWIKKCKQETIKSVIDYILLDEKFLPVFQEMVIDEERIFTPFRLTKPRGQQKVTFSDHSAMLMKLRCTKGKVTTSAQKRKVWNFTTEGFTSYQELTATEVQIDTTKPAEEVYEQWTNHLQSILAECFEKKTVGKGSQSPKLSMARRNVRNALQRMAKRGKVQRGLVKEYLKYLYKIEAVKIEARRAKKLIETANLLTEGDKFSPSGFWKLKKSVSPKKSQAKLTSVISNNIEVSGEVLIKNEFSKEFQHRLRNREPHDEWENYTNNINELLKILLHCQVDETPEFSMKELKKAIGKLKRGKAPGRDGLPSEVFMNAGDGLLKALLEVFNKVKRTKEIPRKWDKVSITTLYKNKGSKKELVNYRGIFLTLIVTKIFENLLKGRMEDQLKSVNMHQAGSRPNRSPADNLFLLYACIDHQKYKGKPLFLTAYDFEQAFDGLWLQECIISMWNIGVPIDILHLVYNLNKRAQITVNTPYGPTEEITVEDIVEQGTVLGPNLCSTSTAEYCETNKGVAVGETIVSSLLFVDDAFDLSTTADDTEESHVNAMIFGRRKKLPYSKKKCKSLTVNGKKCRQPELFIEDTKMEAAKFLVYLGDVINEKGNSNDLAKDRVKRGTSAMIRIEALVKETGLGIHQVSVHLLLYQSLFLSSILFNSQAWSNIMESDLAMLETLQIKCLKKILNVPQSSTNSFTYLEFGEIPMRYLIERNQLMFLHHIMHLEDDDPVKIMLKSMQDLHGERNWWSKVKMSLDKYGITICDVTTKARETFKDMVKEKTVEAAFKELTDECKSKSKTKCIEFDSLETAEYLKHLYPAQSKIIFQGRSKTLDIKDHRQYKYNDMVCRRCKAENETFTHIANCGYEDKVDASIIFNMRQFTYDTKILLIIIANRVQDFLEEVNE